MENYIVINGKKAELTEDQLKALGIELPKSNPFARRKLQETYYSMTSKGSVVQLYDVNDIDDNSRYAIANYCTDFNIMKQRSLYETFLRLLWRYSMTHKSVGDVQYEIYYDCERKKWDYLSVGGGHNYFAPKFDTKEIAKNAIEEIVKPFMAEHPDFKW